MNERQERLQSYLESNCIGPANRRTNNRIACDLSYPDVGSAGRAGLENSRLLTADFNALRENHVAVCADNRGIFLAEYSDDGERMLKDYRNRASVYSTQAGYLEDALCFLQRRKKAA